MATVLAAAILPTGLEAQDSTGALADDILPAGFGTLHQEDIALRLRGENIQIKVLPLDERVIRLLSPDSYRALRGLKQLKAREIDDAKTSYGVHDPSLFFVTFFALRKRARFTPEDLTITSRGRFFRPIAVIALTPRWGEQQLDQRETAVAVYLYDEDIEVLEPFVVSYAGGSTASWERNLRKLDDERAAVIARAAAAGKS